MEPFPRRPDKTMTQTTHYAVTGMKCAGCIKAATLALEKLPGYEGVDFDLSTGSMVLRGDIDPDTVSRTLTDSGYPATPAPNPF